MGAESACFFLMEGHKGGLVVQWSTTETTGGVRSPFPWLSQWSSVGLSGLRWAHGGCVETTGNHLRPLQDHSVDLSALPPWSQWFPSAFASGVHSTLQWSSVVVSGRQWSQWSQCAHKVGLSGPSGPRGLSGLSG